MDKKECLSLMGQYFQIQSCIVGLKNPDFELKSHIFFFKDTFKEIDEIKIVRVSSKNTNDNIIFDIFYVSHEFNGLFHGFFKVRPESFAAQKLFENVSKVCTDLSDYMYYLYQDSTLLKIYLMSGNFQNTLEQYNASSFTSDFKEYKKNIYREIADYSAEELTDSLLDRRSGQKYISNFIVFNSKCSEQVKMFLINLLSDKCLNHICLINSNSNIKNYIYANSNSVYFNANHLIPVYGLLDYIVSEQFILFLKFDFDFEGGVNVGKTVGKR